MSLFRNFSTKFLNCRNISKHKYAWTKYPCPNSFIRYYSQSGMMKVVVIGAAGKTGQPVSLMLKQSNFIDELAIMDVVGTCGVGLELGHIDTKCKVYAYTGYSNIKECLMNAKIVTILASAPKSSILPLSEMFEPNAIVIKEIAELCAEYCPNATYAIATNPINSIVPLFSEIMKKEGVYNPQAIFGVTSIDVIRANTFVAEVLGLDPECVVVPVIGGHSEKTIVPVLSHTKPYPDFKPEELDLLTKQIQQAQQNVTKIKSNEGACLCGAFAIARFVISLVKGLSGHGNIIECAYVRSAEHPHAKYLSTPLQIGSSGLQKNLGIPHLTEYENCLLERAFRALKEDIKKAEQFVGAEYPPACPEPDKCIEDENIRARCPIDWCEFRENKNLN